MSKKGGYKIVSLGRLNLLGESLVLVGLYSALVNSYDKPIMLSDINIDGEIKKDALVQAEKGQNKVTIKNLYGYDLEISNEDAITVSESSLGIELPKPTPEDDGSLVGVNVQGKYVLKPNPLAEATSGDNGKVLEVINGDWGIGGKKVNVIDAPTSTTLTDDQINIIKEGIFINGIFLGYHNPILTPSFSQDEDQPYMGFIIGKTNETYSRSVITQYSINRSTKEISVQSSYGIISMGYRRLEDRNIQISYLGKVNGKEIPSYPANTGTFTLKCVDGVLTWVQDV